MKDLLNGLRLEIDGTYQLVKEIKSINDYEINKRNSDVVGKIAKERDFNVVAINSSELKHCERSLLLAKAWIGKLLGELGGESPYKNDGKRTDVASIEKTDAVNQEGLINNEIWNEKNVIQKVDWLRQRVAEIADKVKTIDHDTKLATREQNICRSEIWKNLVNARLDLGFELQRIKEQGE